MTLTDHLQQLEKRAILTAAPDDLYHFEHPLYQEIGYDFQLPTDRRTLHLALGEMLEQRYVERLSEMAPLLADHFLRGGDDYRALNYFTLAGDYAFATYANAEAVYHYQMALDLALSLQVTPAQLAHLYLNLGQTLEHTGAYQRALDVYQGMHRGAVQWADLGLALAALIAQATLYALPNPIYNAPLAEQLAEQALVLARQLGDRNAEARVLWLLLLQQNSATGDRDLAITYGQQALTIARNLEDHPQMAFILHDLATAYLLAGQLDTARSTRYEATALWQELGNQAMLAESLANTVSVNLLQGHYDEALAQAEKATRLSTIINQSWGLANSRYLTGIVYLERGEFETAIDLMHTALSYAQQAGHTAATLGLQADLALAYGWLGVPAKGIDLARAALETVAPDSPLRPWVMATLATLYTWDDNLIQAEAAVKESYRNFRLVLNPAAIPARVTLADGETALRRNDFNRVLTISDNVLRHFTQTGVQQFKTEILYLKARALIGLRRDSQAVQVLQAALNLAETLTLRTVWWQILLTLSSLQTNTSQADFYRGQARDLIDGIADHLTDPALRRAFLSQPLVKQAFVPSQTTNQGS